MTEILLVDDSAVDRQLFAGLLRADADFEVRACEDGRAALEAMTTELPDIVVTDMQMPVMDGLELVNQIRERFPDTPVILITGHGSEILATKALRAGAAGYVPKSHGNELLNATIRHVLELTKSSRISDKVNSLTSSIRYELHLPNDETIICEVLQLVRQRVSEGANADSATLLQIEVALEHAILNAIYHGNLDFRQHADIEFDKNSRIRQAKILSSQPPYDERNVSLSILVTSDEAQFVVKDQGNGFDVKEVSATGLPQSLRGDFGQGLFLMWAFMDKVLFDKTGSKVTLIKRLESKPIFEAIHPELDSDDPKRVLATLQDKESNEIYRITKERATVGSDRTCDIFIDSASVSKQHCLLFLHKGWWFVRNLENENGIKVDGVAHDSHVLLPSSTLSVGSFELSVEYHPNELGAAGNTPPVNPF